MYLFCIKKIKELNILSNVISDPLLKVGFLAFSLSEVEPTQSRKSKYKCNSSLHWSLASWSFLFL